MIVGVIGKKRSGKDTFASTLIAERGFERVAFADPMKEAVYTLNPTVFWPAHFGSLDEGAWVPKRLADIVDRHGWEVAKDTSREVRRLLQVFGTEVGRSLLGEDVWIDLAFRKMKSWKDYVVTDVRFPNEADRVAAAGGVLVRIIRPGMTHTDTHASETALDDYPVPYTVINDGTLEDLAAQARSLIL